MLIVISTSVATGTVAVMDTHEKGSSSGILSPEITAGVAIGFLLSLSLGVAVVFAIVCLVRHRRAKSTRDELHLGKGTARASSFKLIEFVSD